MPFTPYQVDMDEAFRLRLLGYQISTNFGASGGPGSSGPSGTYGSFNYWVVSAPSSARAAPVATAPLSPSVVTGIDPSEVSNALYGKPIPLSALGLARIGTAGLIFGPY